MKKILSLFLALVAALTLTGCGHVDPTTTINPNDHSVYHYNKIHILEGSSTEKCHEITYWEIIPERDMVKVYMVDHGEKSYYLGMVILVEDKCPICDAEEGSPNE